MFCENCGNQISDTARFCGNCGTAFSPPENTDAPVAQLSPDHYNDTKTSTPEAEEISLTWENQIRILKNPDVWSGILMAFGISAFLLGIFLSAISKSLDGLLLAAGIFTFLMTVFVVVGFVIDLFGGFQVRFALTTFGVRSIAGKGAKIAANTAFWVGVLTGKAGTAGAGILARSEQNNFISFQDVSEVKLHPGRCYIRVKGGFLQKPIALYCLPDNYIDAEAILRQKCSRAKFI